LLLPHSTVQVFGHSPEVQPFAHLFIQAGISGAALQGASDRDLDVLLKTQFFYPPSPHAHDSFIGIGAMMGPVASVVFKSAVKIWNKRLADAIQRAAASKVRASGRAPA
jgi:hypothetical protein